MRVLRHETVEGLTIDYESDWEHAERVIESGAWNAWIEQPPA